MVGKNGSAIVVYEDGCQQKVAPGAVVTIWTASPCSGAGGVAGQPGLVLGAMAVAGGVGGAVILSSDNDHHHPASP
jgi:hypothetical protein